MAHTTLPGPPRMTVYADNAYDLQHFIGSEIRKAAARGQRVTLGGVALTVGESSNRPDDAGGARRAALHPLHPIRVGRSRPGVVALLADPEVRVVAVDDQWQLYRGGRLLAAFDAGTAMAADAAGIDTLSSEQIAAVLAPRLLTPANDFDRHWGDDLAAFAGGCGTGLAAADGVCLALIHGPLAGDGVPYLGGRLTIPIGPDCGQGACDDHRCPAATATPPPASAVPGSPPAAGIAPATFAPRDLAAPPPAALPALPPPQVTVTPQIDVRFDAGRVADALADLLRPAIVTTVRDAARGDRPAAADRAGPGRGIRLPARRPRAGDQHPAGPSGVLGRPPRPDDLPVAWPLRVTAARLGRPGERARRAAHPLHGAARPRRALRPAAPGRLPIPGSGHRPGAGPPRISAAGW